MNIAPIFVLGVLVAVAGYGSMAANEESHPCPLGTQGSTLGQGNVLENEVTINGELQTGTSVPVSAGNVICTDHEDGLFKFDVTTRVKQARCKLRANSSLKVQPQPNVVLEVLNGRVKCRTKSSEMPLFGVRAVYMASTTAEVFVSDPVFGIFVNPRRLVIVKVSYGFAEVAGRNRKVIVGPRQQVVVPPDGNPRPVAPLNLTRDDAVDFEELAVDLPKPDFGRPNWSGSPSLRRILAKRKTLIVGVDKATIAGKRRSFLREFFEFQAKSWKIGFKLKPVVGEKADRMLSRGEIDVAITPKRTPLARAKTLVFFSAPPAATWVMAVNPDKVYLNAMRRFLEASLVTGQYDALYRESFGVAPGYAPLSPLLFP